MLIPQHNPATFVHLGVRSEYSLVDSIVRIKDLVARAKEDGQTHLGLCDANNLFASIKFYKACIAADIVPLIGVELTTCLEYKEAKEHKQSVLVYAMNEVGYKNLLTLVSLGYTEHLSQGAPIYPQEVILAHNTGLMVILTDQSGWTDMVIGGNYEGAKQWLDPWQEAFGDRLYAGIKRTDRAGEDAFIEGAISVCHMAHIPLLGLGDVRFLDAQDFEAHEVKTCIAGSYILADKTRPRFYSQEQYLKTQSQMQEVFADLPQVVDNTARFARRCAVSIPLGTSKLPEFPVPKGSSIETYFAQISKEGLEQRLAHLYPTDARGEDWPQVRAPYDTRLEFEIGVILKMGFPGYFLIVMDFIRWAKNNGVPVGPGRGSGAGSLVAYALNITDLDPLHYDLLFERFLNPERVSMPDFDIDFCIDGRDRVIDYVAKQYGRDAVSQIITFGTMAAKAVVRDVARVQGKSYGLADKISKLIPKTPGISLLNALEETAELKDLILNPNNPDQADASEIWETALTLEGLVRNVGKHAGGVLIAPGRISDFSAIYTDAEGHRVSQLDKDDVESVGLVKFDFLGLRNLTVIDSALDNINKRRQQEGLAPLLLESIALDDDEVYTHILQNAKTSAVFQLESHGMKKYLAQLQPAHIEDVIAMCALYRPGPLETGMVSMYINRRHGREQVVYDHPWLEDILSNTYGVIVYQEQVMQISQVLAGYTLGQADMLRRAMGKKKPEEMARHREIFTKGAKEKNIDEKVAHEIFDLMETFAGYGFNKSHSAAYGVLAYQTAYLKHYYPAEFMAAVLTSEMGDTDKIVSLSKDCREGFGLSISVPSINEGYWSFVAKDERHIIYGLGAIKGLGAGAVESIVQARSKGGAFKDLHEFCQRVDIKKVGKRALEALIYSGSFDEFGANLSLTHAYDVRLALFNELPNAMRGAEQTLKNTQSGMLDMFAQSAPITQSAPLDVSLVWDDKKRLTHEKATLGVYLTGHPTDQYQKELTRYGVLPFDALTTHKNALLGGIVEDISHFGNRSVLWVSDASGRFEIGVYADTYARVKHLLKVGEVLMFQVRARQSEDGSMRLILNTVHTLEQARVSRLGQVQVRLGANEIQKATALLKMAQHYDEAHQLQLVLWVEDEALCAKVATTPLGIIPTDTHLQQLSAIFGAQNIHLGGD